jgi:capsule polysaccharide export protein KpsE/RkpR
METATRSSHALEQLNSATAREPQHAEAWVANAELFWMRRRTLAKATLLAFVLSTTVAFILPKKYESSTRIMPPEQAGGSAAMLAALVGKGSGSSLAGLAGGLLGSRGNGALFISLLRSGTVSGHIIKRFDLQRIYKKRYVEDTAKRLSSRTIISEDSKSGVITIGVEDTERSRARDITQAYLDELNTLVAAVNTSSARREREFIEQRLQSVSHDLQHAQEELRDFSTQNATIDIKEQTRAMVDAGAKLQGLLVASESELNSLQQIYGSQNVRVRAAEARVGSLRRELARESDGGAPPPSESVDSLPYPALRQLPALAVPWANLYRQVRIQETVYELLSAQYETARIEEAKSIPTVRVIDPPGWPEKKSSPHRLIIILVSTLLAFVVTSFFLMTERWWFGLYETDAKRVLVREIVEIAANYSARLRRVPR